MLKKIMKIIAAIYLAISFAVLFVFIYNWYFTAESRYVRDNLQYVSEQMEKHGIGKAVKTGGIHTFRYPTPAALLELYDDTSEWVDGTAKFIDKNRELTGKFELRFQEVSPYETLSRLEYNKAVDPNITTVYEAIKLDAAAMNPETIETEYDKWKENMVNEHFEVRTSIDNIYQQFMSTMFLTIILFIPPALMAVLLNVLKVVKENMEYEKYDK